MYQIVVFILLSSSAFFTCTAFQLSSSSSSLYRQKTYFQKRNTVQHTKIFGFFDSFKDIFKVEEEEPLNVPFKRTDREWRALLTEEEFYVLRGAGTERPWTSSLNDEKRPGEFTCKGCGKTLFTSSTKFNSGTGWPSFFAPASSSSVLERKDSFIGLQRTEVLCSNCGSHLGHVFNDGPRPTKQRYCINGVCLVFRKEGSEKEGTQQENLKKLIKQEDYRVPDSILEKSTNSNNSNGVEL